MRGFSRYLSMANQLQRWSTYSIITIVTALVTAVLTVQFRLAIANHLSPYPQGIFVLGGGNKTREPAAAKFATYHPTLEIWVSSGLLPPQANEIFLSEGISLTRLNLDYRATDTVTNFTTLIDTLQAKEICHVYLVTSDFHMRRAKAIAFWVLGSRGIAYTPVIVPSEKTPEPYYKVLRDVVRSWLWILTGHTGSSLEHRLPTPRWKHWET